MAIDEERIRQIAEALRAEGRRSEADELADTVAAGATSTEIFMALRWQLQKIDAEGPTLGTRRKIRELIDELDRVLS